MNIDERIEILAQNLVNNPTYKSQVKEGFKHLIKDVLAEVVPERIDDNPLSASQEHRFYHNQTIDEMEAKIKELGL